MKQNDWINTFFMILVILLIVSGICWFFGFRIPTAQQINNNVERSKIPTTYNTGTNCTAFILAKWEGVPNALKSEYDIENYLSAECAGVCSRKSVGLGTLNSILVESDISHPYDCDTNNNLICYCKVY